MSNQSCGVLCHRHRLRTAVSEFPPRIPTSPRRRPHEASNREPGGSAGNCLRFRAMHRASVEQTLARSENPSSLVASGPDSGSITTLVADPGADSIMVSPPQPRSFPEETASR